MADHNAMRSRIAAMIAGQSPARASATAMTGQDLRSAGRPASSLKRYNPTLRDRLASWMLGGDERPSDDRRRIVTGLVGSTGLGNEGLSAADFTPAGMTFNAEETGRAIGNGAYGDAAMSALGMLPAAAVGGGIGLARNMTQKAGKAASAWSEPLEEFASRSAYIYDPPVKPQRPFEADYPAGEKSYVERGIADEADRLQVDMDGEPLTAEYVVGRTHVGEPDVALPREALDEIAKARTGEAIRRVAPRSAEIGNDVGRTVFRRGGKPDYVAVSNALNEDQYQRVAAHEIGHLLDRAAGEIPTDGLIKELRAIYSDANNPQGHGKGFGPEQNGYRGGDVPRELMSESIRAYLTDPNYIKTVGEKTAARIRDYVRNHPELKNLIQFNSLGAGAIGAGMMTDEQFEDAWRKGNGA